LRHDRGPNKKRLASTGSRKEQSVKPKLLTTQEWEKSAKNFNFKDDRVKKKLAEFNKTPDDAYDELVRCLADVRHLAKLLPAETHNAARFLADFIQAVEKEQAMASKAGKAARTANVNETFTAQEAANLIRKIKFSGLKWDPKRLQQAHQVIDKATKACHWNGYTHFARRVLERGPKYKIHDGDDLQAAIQGGRSQASDEGKFEHRLTNGGIISYNPSSRTIITLV
jgi:hypothetical protein